ncbi:unnamed protein product [Ilex paraguariensis]|uniref:ENT domain-containing protein n=1 Tax=Ilex paraguariensis TaxID=185542 RepID=A0ABC8U9J9_9AQUA
MRFKRGSRVEVMKKNEVPFSWRCAKIMSGDGHTYNVRYDCHPDMTSEQVEERVSRKAIRPCPPLMEGVESWMAGDVVEIFDQSSWRIATVLKDLDGHYYLVRLLGSSKEFRVHQSNIRVRQSWQDDKWVVMGKGSANWGDVKSKKLLTTNCYRKASFQVPLSNAKITQPAGHECRDAGLQDSHMVSSRTLKRASPYYSSTLEAYPGNFHKIRGIEKEGTRAPLVEKVDAVAYPKENLGEKYMHSFFINKSNGYYELERGKLNGVVGCSLAKSSDPDDSDSDECSVGSCSVTSKSPIKFRGRFVPIPCRETVTLCSDAESSCNLGGEDENCLLPPKEEVAESIHRLELHAYRCTLEAFYASGPLSWEKEELLTNLRITLYISNDEHLKELRDLISAGTGFHIS